MCFVAWAAALERALGHKENPQAAGRPHSDIPREGAWGHEANHALKKKQGAEQAPHMTHQRDEICHGTKRRKS
jgi:hypothetical protein